MTHEPGSSCSGSIVCCRKGRHQMAGLQYSGSQALLQVLGPISWNGTRVKPWNEGAQEAFFSRSAELLCGPAGDPLPPEATEAIAELSLL